MKADAYALGSALMDIQVYVKDEGRAGRGRRKRLL